MEYGIKSIQQVQSLQETCLQNAPRLKDYATGEIGGSLNRLAEDTGAPEFAALAEGFKKIVTEVIEPTCDAITKVSEFTAEAIEEYEKHQRAASSIMDM